MPDLIRIDVPTLARKEFKKTDLVQHTKQMKDIGRLGETIRGR